MGSITVSINISEDHMKSLHQKAAYSKMTIEQFIEKYVERMLESNERETLMEEVTEYVLTKNHELLKRLA